MDKFKVLLAFNFIFINKIFYCATVVNVSMILLLCNLFYVYPCCYYL